MKLLITFLVVCCVAALVSAADVEQPQPAAVDGADSSVDGARDKRGVTVSVTSPGAAVVPAAGYPYYPYGYPYGYSYGYPYYYPYGSYSYVVAGK